MNTPLFIAPSLWNDQLNDYVAAACVVLLIILQLVLRKLANRHEPKIYSPQLAWLRALSYFLAAYCIGWYSGVIDTLIDTPFIRDEQLSHPLWQGMTALCFAVILFGYLRIWKVGTFHDNRIYRWWLTPWYGMAWGFAQASVFLSIWAAIELSSWKLWVTAILAYVAIGAYNGCLQQFYWDIYISPPHNQKAFNVRKVLLVHMPNLIVCIIYLYLFGNLAMYFILQGLALGISASIMRFPAWFDDYRAVAGATR